MKKTVKKGVVTLIAFLLSLFGLAVLWCLRTWQRLSMDELIFELSAPLRGTGSDMIIRFILNCLLPAVIITAGASFFVFYKKKSQVLKWWLVLSGIVAISSTIVLASRLNAYEYLVNMGEESTFIEDNYVNPEDVKITFPEKKRNLIYIFLESMEMTYSDIEDGGGFKENLIPELTELAKENECFSGDDKLNGGYVTSGTSWTMGGMFAQTSGLPLKINVQGNAMEHEECFFPGIKCIGDVLEKEGYNQELLIGSEAEFGGRQLYFASHGDYAVHDYNYALNTGIIPPGYQVYWGYEDMKLFEHAKNDLLELSKKDEPFNLTMLTVDTHFPSGYKCELCENRFGDNQYANVMACSSKQVKEFVDWIKEQDFYDNTTIVISGDHTTMNETFCDDIPDGYVRRVYTTFINAAVQKKRKDTIEYSTLDMFPTTLAALGADVEGNRLGLGTNLFSGEKTLIEKYTDDEINNQFARHSVFMEEMSGIAGEEEKKRKRLSPDADIYVSGYDETSGMIVLNVDDIINVDNCGELKATLYDEDMNEIQSADMVLGIDRNYSCDMDISPLSNRKGTIVVETAGNTPIKLGELAGDLSIQAHESISDYMELLNKKEDVAVFLASKGDFINGALEKDLAAFKKIGIDVRFDREEKIGFFAVVDKPSIVYGLEQEQVSYDGVLVGNDVDYHVESRIDGDCSIEIGGEDYALNENGLNCVVYDYELGEVVDTASFNLEYDGTVDIMADVDFKVNESGEAELTLRNASDYDIWNASVQIWDKNSYMNPLIMAMESPDEDMANYVAKVNTGDFDIEDAFVEISCHDTRGMQHRILDWNGNLNLLREKFDDYMAYINSLNDAVILMSVKDDMWLSGDDEVIDTLKEVGLNEFENIADHEAYCAYVTPGEVIEKHDVDAISFDGIDEDMEFAINCAGWDAGYYSSINVGDREYSMGEKGINIAIYDIKRKQMIDHVAYRYVHEGGENKIFIR